MTTTTATKPWLASHQPNPFADLRLFCLPYAGGGAAIYRAWPDFLPISVELVPVHLPGRETRINEPPFTRLRPLVETLAAVITPHLDKPFAIFGHSMGALIGFELARQLRREHKPQPVHLFISGRDAPHLAGGCLHTFQLPEPEFVEEVRRLNGTPKEVLDHQELRKLVLPSLRSDFEIVQTYAYLPEPKLDCPISVFGGLQDRIPRLQLEGWREHTNAAFSLDMLPGDHFFLRTSQHRLLDMLSHKLNHIVGTLPHRRRASWDTVGAKTTTT